MRRLQRIQAARGSTSTPNYANRSADGTIVGVSCIVEDITEHNRVEEALRASEKRFRTLFSNAGDSILIVDTEGRILDANRRACSSLGYSLQELQGLAIPDIDVDWSPDAISDAVAKQLADGQVITVEGRQRRKDGSIFPVEVRSQIIDLDDKPYFIASCRDIK